MENQEKRHWDTENLVFFGMFLNAIGESGYGLLVIHASTMGLKVGKLLGRKWYEFIDPETNECEASIQFDGVKKEAEKSRELNEFVRDITTAVYRMKLQMGTVTSSDDIYINAKTGKALTTSTLKRELQRLDKMFRRYLVETTMYRTNLQEIDTNTFEMAWGRDMVKLYNYSKKVFSVVSDYLGHQSIGQTVEFLGVPCVDDVKLRFDFYPYATSKITSIDKADFSNKAWLVNYLQSSGTGIKLESVAEVEELKNLGFL